MSAISANLPVTVNPSNAGDLVRAQPVCNPDGSLVNGTPGPQTSANSQSVTGAQSPAASAEAATPYDARPYSSSEAQVSGLSGGDTITFTRSIDGTNYAPVSWVDQGFATGGASPFTISANGIYSFPGGGYLKWAQTGSASTPTVTVRAAS